MDLRTRISTSLKKAMKEKEAERISTLRLINAAIKDKDIAARAEGNDEGVGDDEVVFFRCGQRGGSAAQAFCHIKDVLPTAPSAQTKHGVSATRGCVHGEW